MAWRVARSLDVLLGQVDVVAPRRSKISDGSIGDAAHASRDSDHNPWLSKAGTGIVTARDFTHDPAAGLDCNRLAEALVRSRDPRIKYIIWNRRILSGSRGPSPWVWRSYSGPNPHDKHLHLSVESSPDRFDDAREWAIQPPVEAPKEDEMTPDEKRTLAKLAEQVDELHDLIAPGDPGKRNDGVIFHVLRAVGVKILGKDEFDKTFARFPRRRS